MADVIVSVQNCARGDVSVASVALSVSVGSAQLCTDTPQFADAAYYVACGSRLGLNVQHTRVLSLPNVLTHFHTAPPCPTRTSFPSCRSARSPALAGLQGRRHPLWTCNAHTAVKLTAISQRSPAFVYRNSQRTGSSFVAWVRVVLLSTLPRILPRPRLKPAHVSSHADMTSLHSPWPFADSTTLHNSSFDPLAQSTELAICICRHAPHPPSGCRPCIKVRRNPRARAHSLADTVSSLDSPLRNCVVLRPSSTLWTTVLNRLPLGRVTWTRVHLVRTFITSCIAGCELRMLVVYIYILLCIKMQLHLHDDLYTC